MRKIYNLLFTLFTFCLALTSSAQTITIGSGTSTQRFPLGHFWGYERTASLYTTAEMSAVAGSNITSLAWYVATTAGTVCPTKIYLKTTTSAPLTTNTWASFISGATLVYDASTTPSPTNGWYTVPLSTPFLYTGDNLLVLVEMNFTGTGGGTNPTLRYSTSTSNQAYWTADNTPPSGNATSLNSNRTNIQITYVSSTPCSGTPAPGNTVASANPVCPGANLNLSLQNSTSGSGVTYQWQSADDAAFSVGLTNLGTSSSQSTTQTTAKYYRCLVTCTNSGMATYSTPLQVTMNPVSNCYCTPTTSGGNTWYVTNFTTTGAVTNINNTSAGSATGYQDFFATQSMTASQNSTFNYSINAPAGDTYGYGMWIDYNQNGTFEPSEQVVSTSSYTNPPKTGTINIPGTATLGVTRLRIVATFTPNNPSNPCLNSGSGEYEDYKITITAPPPCTVTCPANITVNSTPGMCGANVTLPPPTTTGTCGTITYTPASGSFFPVGTTTVNVTTGTGPTCSFTVTVLDVEPPVITCPANITKNNDPNLCGAVVNYSLPVALDNCAPGAAITLTQTASQTPVAGSVACNSGGIHTDNSYWRAYNLAPLNLTGALTINNVQFGVEQAIAGSGSSQPATIRLYTQTTGTFPSGTWTQIYSQGITIPNQNLSVMSVALSSPPTVPANAVVIIELFTPAGGNNSFFVGSNNSTQTGPSYISAAACSVTTPTDLASIGFPDMHLILNMSGTVPSPIAVTQIAGIPSGGTFPVGTTVNTYKSTDGVGNSSTCSFNVTVVDAQAPVITCPGNITATTPAGSCTAVVNYNVTATDNCAGVTTSLVSGLASGSAFPLGVNTVTWKATDAVGNTSTCTFTVTVKDGQLPTITAQPANKFGCVGGSTAFSVTAVTAPNAGGPLSYQWQAWNGSAWVNITGATASTLPLTNLTLAMNTNSYRVNITGLCTTITSGLATLYVNSLPNVSIATSIPPVLLPTQNVTLTAVVNPAGGAYQWFKNGVAINGATSQSLSGLTVNDAGTYKVRYTDLNGCTNTSADMEVAALTSDFLYIYPNPNNGQFHVRFYNTVNEDATIKIYAYNGALVYTKVFATTLPYTDMNVDLGGRVANGIYVVEVRSATDKLINAKQIRVQVN